MALLNAGESPDEDRTSRRPSIFSASCRAQDDLVVSLQTMVLCRATPVNDQLIIARNVEWLEDSQVKSGPADRKGGWSYFESRMSVPAKPSQQPVPSLALPRKTTAFAESNKITVEN